MSQDTALNNSRRMVCDCHAINEDAVRRVRQEMPGDRNFHDLTNLYKMFADGTRVRILWVLSREDMCVCDLAVLLNMTKSAISHQLKSLRYANLVRANRQGKVVYYSLVECHAKSIFNQGFEHILE